MIEKPKENGKNRMGKFGGEGDSSRFHAIFSGIAAWCSSLRPAQQSRRDWDHAAQGCPIPRGLPWVNARKSSTLKGLHRLRKNLVFNFFRVWSIKCHDPA